ncbi:MAG: DEAD/DEAH box helicase family protein, partial [Culturomica sp.]|nr:DEAD/DEAH box helicase family protein [Culturomica sp.]
QILSQSAVSVDFLVNVSGENEQIEYVLIIDGENVIPESEGKRVGWNRYSYACLLQYEQELTLLDPKEKIEHKKYSRQGMIKRVLDERREKASKAQYRIKWANNVYGDHILTNEKGHHYKVFLRNFENETGYSDSWDSQLNKLGTTKHIMFAFNALKKDETLFGRLDKTYPFVEIYCDPLNDNKISWYYPHELSAAEQALITQFFGKQQCIDDSEIQSFLEFIEKACDFEHICIRPEVRKKVERAFDKSLLKDLQHSHKPDYSLINAELFPYQKEGVEFVLFKKAAIIADEMGLGKTIQAIAAAVLKKQIFGFKKTLIVCPATLKSQWKKEIEKFTNERAIVVSGLPDERKMQYTDNSYSFYIVNYETILRDSLAINNAEIDFLILDEAQKIKNFETKTSSAIRRLQPKHTLIITGTPIENRLIDIYSLVSVLDPYFFGPLWEFSYQHCLFDPEKNNKINGYFDLQPLNARLSEILIRREKRAVLDQLPNVQQIDIPIQLSPEQAEYHASFSAGIAKIISKKFLTAYDLQRLQVLLTNMRMVCDSTYLIDEQTNVSPKMEELHDILFNKLDLQNADRKVIIFSEWVKVHKLIGQMLRHNNVGFVELNGKVPVKSRGELIKKFEQNAACKVFLSTEAGGAGLNLQMADILINFELPWNPAKKNQRIGRIDRLGQKSNKLTIYNLITKDSIEQQIAAGLLVKQSLFEGVLDKNNTTNYVDFSTKGRSQFIEQLEAFINQTDNAAAENPDEENEKIIESPIEEQELFNPEDFEETIEEQTVENSEKTVEETSISATETETKAAELEQVMNTGMQLLAGLFKMSTGKNLGVEGQKITVNKETGEVTMTFKLPM